MNNLRNFNDIFSIDVACQNINSPKKHIFEKPTVGVGAGLIEPSSP